MNAQPKNTIIRFTRIDEKDLDRHARLISQLSWTAIMITLITAITLWLVGAPVLVMLLMAPLVLVGIVILLSTSKLSAALHITHRRIQRLEENNYATEKMRNEQELSNATKVEYLEHRARLLQASGDVLISLNSIIFKSIQTIDQFFQESVLLISEGFGLLSVKIFIFETNNGQEMNIAGETSFAEQLILRAADSNDGRKLIENNYSLSLSQDNPVSTAARTQLPIFASKPLPSPLYLENSESLEDSTEVALPLFVGDKLLGVLDLQGSLTSPLRLEDLNLLQTLANQISSTYENASVLNLNQNHRQSLAHDDDNLSQKTRQNLLRNQPERGFCADLSGVLVSVNDSWHPLMIEARESGQIVFGNPISDGYTLAVPVKIRNQIAGVVRLRKPLDGGEWRPDEVSLVERLSDRLSAALESARLFEETRRAAEREHLTGEITTRMRSTNDPQTVLQIAARELRKALRADKAQVLVHTAVVRPPIASNDCSEDYAGDQS